MFDFSFQPSALHSFFQDYSSGIQHAAYRLGGSVWLRRSQKIIDAMSQPLSPTRRTLDEIQKLYDLLTLEHVHDIEHESSRRFAEIDPASPAMEEICLLVDQMRDAAEESGLLLDRWFGGHPDQDFLEAFA